MFFGLVPGRRWYHRLFVASVCVIVLVGRAPFDGPVTIEVEGSRHAIGLALAERIRVAGAAA